jgi:hypothetical protein
MVENMCPSLRSHTYTRDKVMRTLKITMVPEIFVLIIPLLTQVVALGSISRGIIAQMATPIYDSSLEETIDFILY